MRCQALTVQGGPCQSWASESGYCFIHDPGQAGKRAAARKKGGQSHRAAHGGDISAVPRAVKSLGDILGILDYTLGELISLDNSIARGRALIALAHEYIESIRATELENRVTELEKRIYDNNIGKAR